MKRHAFLVLAAVYTATALAQKPLLRQILANADASTAPLQEWMTSFVYSQDGLERFGTTFQWDEKKADYQRSNLSREVFDGQGRTVFQSDSTLATGRFWSMEWSSQQPLASHSRFFSRDSTSWEETIADSVFESDGRLAMAITVMTDSSEDGLFRDTAWTENSFAPDGKLLETRLWESGGVSYRRQFFYDATVSDSTVLERSYSDYGLGEQESGSLSLFYDADRRLERTESVGYTDVVNPWCGFLDGDIEVTRFFWNADGLLVRTLRTDSFQHTLRRQVECNFQRQPNGQLAATELVDLDQIFGFRRIDSFSIDGLILFEEAFFASTGLHFGPPEWELLEHTDFIYDDPLFEPKTADFKLKTAPNPAGLTVAFTSEAFFGRPVFYRISNESGRLMATGHRDGNWSGIEIDVASWPTGTYFFEAVLSEPSMKKAVPFEVCH